MAGELLLDTGALVSLLDRSQRYHAECLAVFEAWDAPVVSTEAVLTEATHLMRGVSGGAETCLGFFLAGGATLVPANDVSLARCKELMERYADLPMDYADASLVTLAEDLVTQAVFTIDGDFEIYRIHGRKRFQLHPSIRRKGVRRPGRRRR